MTRSALTALAALILGLTFAACGDDEDSEGGASDEAKTATFELTGAGKKPKLSAPESVEAGLVDLTLRNGSKGEAGVQLVRFEGDHTAAEAIKAAEAWGEKNRPLPGWLRLEGGVGTTAPGKTGSSTQVLRAGKYLAVDIDSDARTEFEVTGDGGGEVPSTSGKIVMSEYRFEGESLEAGKVKVEFENVGKEPHFAVAAPIKKGSTFADAKKFFSEEESDGPPPVDEKAFFSTAIVDGGGKQVTNLELKSGKYAMACFIPDRRGGPPHVVKGMISEVTVE